MPKYTVEELKNLSNPYKELFEDSDTMAENRDSLEQLGYQDKISVATKMVLACPNNQLRSLSLKSEELRHHQETEESFHRVLSRGLEVRHRIQAMADQQNPHPQNNLLGNEFNADLFNEFRDLKIQLTEQELTDLVNNLVLKTPDNQIQELNQNVRAGLSETKLGPALGEAFVLKRLLTLLQSSEPHLAFTSSDFNPALFHKHPRLVASYLIGREAEIAQRLANSNERAAINSGLEQLKPQVMSNADPLSILYSQFQTANVMAEAAKQHQMTSSYVNTSNITPQEIKEVKPEIAQEVREVKPETAKTTEPSKVSNSRYGKFAQLKDKFNTLVHKNHEHDEENANKSKCRPCNIM
ncbi:Uncharacterised protein [Legionella busanensis]|uniref:Uncharacterized protein n=1 Tax=Legionella busanensis TaxID=190655 RepID=A0A378JII8_9GAMM|nr:hypothetical protein [Legionella busanensis]STX50039.1 Uncharacterised protein [Legionella busanensis]